jgi:dsDNA-specific endonuclease/ATPase MutS2
MGQTEFWIGDLVVIKSSGKEGRFEGKNADGKARISFGSKILLISMDNLIMQVEKNDDDEIFKSLLFEDKETPKKEFKVSIKTIIDLHIVQLAPHMVNELPQRIIDFQIIRCDEFVQEAINKHYPIILIIHGKGQGVLKSEVEHLLKKYDQVRFTFTKNNGGAIEVWLS